MKTKDNIEEMLASMSLFGEIDSRDMWVYQTLKHMIGDNEAVVVSYKTLAHMYKAEEYDIWTSVKKLIDIGAIKQFNNQTAYCLPHVKTNILSGYLSLKTTFVLDV